MYRNCLVALALAVSAAVGSAQVVRGTVTERTSGTRVPGVVVTLQRIDSAAGAGETSDVNVLTTETGAYEVRAPGAGQYRISAKRIGVRRFNSEPFSLTIGETRRLDVELDAVLFTLPEVVVNVNALCAAKQDEIARLSSLWDEAHTALTAAQITPRDSLYRANVTRYALGLDPAMFTVLSETRTDLDGTLARPFESIRSDSLAHIGFWRELPGDSAEYYGPDADVLLSDEFRREHCFTIVDGGRDRRGLIGLAFNPVVNRDLPDVKGTLWLDGRTFELRFVEFRYTHLPSTEYLGRVGGEVHFARVPSGAWIVSRWFVRVPLYARYLSGPKALPKVVQDAWDAAPPVVSRIVEEGASVDGTGLRGSGTTARVTGIVLDSTGRPLAGAAVHFAGERAPVPVDNAGRFQLDSLTAGSYSIIADHPGYAGLGTMAASTFVVLGEGETRDVKLQAIRARQIIPKLCNGLPSVPPRATLRLVMVDSASGALLTGVPVMLSWVESAGGATEGPSRERTAAALTDQNGAVAFCRLPPETPIELSIAKDNDSPIHVSVFGLSKNQVAARMAIVTLPR